jgi:curved DNA-binding protein CbpA
MFLDYYGILQIPSTATTDEIKAAFKKQAIRWHPDKNRGTDTTKQMQEINEAYIILKDFEARQRYDIEYRRFNEYKKKYTKHREERKNEKNKTNSEQRVYSDYNVADEILFKWMTNAQQQAFDLAKISLDELFGMTSAGLKEVGKEAVGFVKFQLGCLAIFGLLILLSALVKLLN